MKTRRILMLFPKDWDRVELEHPRYRAGYRFFYEGFDLFRFPDNARLLTFDARRYVDLLVRRYRGRIDGVVSNNEHFGALIAAVLARRLGLPGNDPAVIIAAQHKYYSRCLQRKIVPEATPRFSVLPYARRIEHGPEIGFPCFVKPVGDLLSAGAPGRQSRGTAGSARFFAAGTPDPAQTGAAF